jgi:hypothetical protein
MQFTASLTRFHLREARLRMGSVVRRGTLCLVAALSCIACSQQAASPGTPVAGAAPKASAPAPVVVQSGPRWQELTKSQRLILQPLASTWDSLTGAHKSKWIAVAQTYPSRAETEQKKMQDRMVEWAALTPVDRERARLNFAETKKIPPSDRAAEWEAYQGLSLQEKQYLASKGSARPAGAAIAVTPVAPSKLTPVPVTRHTAMQDSDAAVPKPNINPNTLLPAPPTPVSPPVSTPAQTDAAPPEPPASVSPAPSASAPVN